MRSIRDGREDDECDPKGKSKLSKKKIKKGNKKKHCRRIQKKKVTVRIRTSEKRREG